MLFYPFSGLCLDYYVNGATGSDSSATCGQVSTALCKTIKQALDNIPDGEVTIKIARGTYVEDHLGVWGVNAPDVRNVAFEGGWNSDFSSHSCNTSGTTIVPGDTSNSGWPVLFHLFVSGANNQAAMTIRCMTIQKVQSGDITQAIYLGAEQQGQANLTMDRIKITGFYGSLTTRFYSHTGGSATITIKNSIFTRNKRTVFQGDVDNGSLRLFAKKNLYLKNGVADEYSVVFYLDCHSGGSLIADFENNIIAGNTTVYDSAGIILTSTDNASSILFNSTNDTITDNTCTNRGAAVQVIAEHFGDIQVNMKNSVLQGNHADYSPMDLSLLEGMFDDYSGTVNFSADYCIIGDYALRHGTPTYTSIHEIDADPALNPTYHLTSGSPAKDAGICGYLTGGGPYQYHRVAPYDDIDGDKRPGWGKLIGCDVGADEYRFPWILFNPATRGTRRP